MQIYRVNNINFTANKFVKKNIDPKQLSRIRNNADNDIRKGIIISDKGFPPSQIKTELAERPELHFLTPIKRNDSRIMNNDMLSFDGVLTGVGEHVLYKKKSIKGGRFLYAFKSAKKASAEEAGFLARREKQKDFSLEKYEKKRLFCTIGR